MLPKQADTEMLILGGSELSAAIKWVERNAFALSLPREHRGPFPNEHLQPPPTLPPHTETHHLPCLHLQIVFLCIGNKSHPCRKVKLHHPLSGFRQPAILIANPQAFSVNCIWFLKEEGCRSHRILCRSQVEAGTRPNAHNRIAR